MSNITKVAKISVALTVEMTDLIQQAVVSGDYASGSEVIREALREWKNRRAQAGTGQDHLRRLWAEGLASGPGRFTDIDQIKQEARKRQAAVPPATR